MRQRLRLSSYRYPLAGGILFAVLTAAAHATGAAGGSEAVGADASLQHCPETLGTLRIDEGAVNGGQAVTGLRLLIQQSNCFVIVERGVGEASIDDEKARARSTKNEIRDGANMDQGQEVAADFLLRPMILSAGTTNKTQMAGVPFMSKIPLIGGVGASFSKNKAETQLVLLDIRAKIQIAVSNGEGSASNMGLAGGVLSRAGFGAGGTQTMTPEAKLLLQSFGDAYNKLVPALRNYKAQNVKGGLGTGGRLAVQGAQTGNP